MALPAIVAVDDDPNGLGIVETQLVERYARRYRIECGGTRREGFRCSRSSPRTASTSRSCS